MRKLLPTAIIGTIAYGAFARRRDIEIRLHECDWIDYEDGNTQRRFLSISHLLHHAVQTFKVQLPLAEVYLLRTITPAFRERIMIVTAMANSCLL